MTSVWPLLPSLRNISFEWLTCDGRVYRRKAHDCVGGCDRGIGNESASLKIYERLEDRGGWLRLRRTLLPKKCKLPIQSFGRSKLLKICFEKHERSARGPAGVQARGQCSFQ